MKTTLQQRGPSGVANYSIPDRLMYCKIPYPLPLLVTTSLQPVPALDLFHVLNVILACWKLWEAGMEHVIVQSLPSSFSGLVKQTWKSYSTKRQTKVCRKSPDSFYGCSSKKLLLLCPGEGYSSPSSSVQHRFRPGRAYCSGSSADYPLQWNRSEAVKEIFESRNSAVVSSQEPSEVVPGRLPKDKFLQYAGLCLGVAVALGIAFAVWPSTWQQAKEGVAALRQNPTFMSALIAWASAQVLKVFTTYAVEKRFDLRMLFASGGLPSSHSSLVTALTVAVGVLHGIQGALFPVCLGFSLIVMYDATGVRYHAGVQAEVLNIIVADLFQGHPLSEKKLKELLGHTPLQVVAGAVWGGVMSLLYFNAFS